VKVGLEALPEPKHAELKRDNPSPQRPWGACPPPAGRTPSALNGCTCIGRMLSALHSIHG